MATMLTLLMIATAIGSEVAERVSDWKLADEGLSVRPLAPAAVWTGSCVMMLPKLSDSPASRLTIQPFLDAAAPTVALLKKMDNATRQATSKVWATGAPPTKVATDARAFGKEVSGTSGHAQTKYAVVDDFAPNASAMHDLPCGLMQATLGAGQGGTSSGSGGNGGDGGGSPPRAPGQKGKLALPNRAPGKAVRSERAAPAVPIFMRCPCCERTFKSAFGFTQHQQASIECRHAVPVAFDPAAEQAQLTITNLRTTTEATAYESMMRETMISRLGNFLYGKNPTPRSHVDDVSKLVGDISLQIKSEVYQRLEQHISEGQLNSLFGVSPTTGDQGIFNVRRGIETAALEESVRSALHAPVVPTRRALFDPSGERTDDYVYDIPLDKELQAWARQTPGLMEEIVAADLSWSQAAAAGEEPTTYSDISDGAVFRKHPMLGCVRAADGDPLRLAFCLYYDDVEVVNPLGAFTGTHKLALFYWVLLNVDSSHRMALHNIHLATVALEHDLAYYGAKQVVSGPPPEAPPAAQTGTAFGDQMRALDEGYALKLPSSNPDDNFEKFYNLRGWLVCLAADYPAAALLVGTKKSVAAHVYCRECYIDQDHEGYPKPHSFLHPERSQLKQRVILRTPECHCRDKKKADAMNTKTEQNDFMTSIGVNTFDHAFVDVPYFDVCRGAPVDFMHVEAEGLLKLELAAVIFYMCRCVNATNLSKINQAMRAYNWEGGAANRPPYFTDGILEGATPPKGSGLKAIPKRGCHVHMTAGDTLRFTLHSVEVLGPLLGKHKASAVWQCWLKHVHYVSMLMQHHISRAQVEIIDRLIFEHHKQFLSIPEYIELYKPKHHFATHFPIDILNFGPPRHYWCMRFEALNQAFKTIAVGGNYKDTCGRCAKIWCSKMAHNRYHDKFDQWGATKVISSLGQFHYDRNCLTDSDWLVDVIFESQIATLPDETRLDIEWIKVMQHQNGMSFHAGQSWVHISLAGSIVVGKLEEHSIMAINGRFYFVVSAYPELTTDSDGMPSVSVASDFEPELEIVPLDAITTLTALWPQEKKEGIKAGMKAYRFVPKG